MQGFSYTRSADDASIAFFQALKLPVKTSSTASTQYLWAWHNRRAVRYRWNLLIMHFAAGYHFLALIRWNPMMPASVLKGRASNRIPDLFKLLRAAEGVTKTLTKTLATISAAISERTASGQRLHLSMDVREKQNPDGISSISTRCT